MATMLCVYLDPRCPDLFPARALPLVGSGPVAIGPGVADSVVDLLRQAGVATVRCVPGADAGHPAGDCGVVARVELAGQRATGIEAVREKITARGDSDMARLCRDDESNDGDDGVVVADTIGMMLPELARAAGVMARAHLVGGWERSQTHAGLLPYLEEEAAEFAEAVAALEEGDEVLEQQVCRELSDLLLQVLFHAEIARRRGAFTVEDVAAAFTGKISRRAPYVFDPGTTTITAEEEDRIWQDSKRREHGAGPGPH
ncbi:MazG nucleotide pyrophosphohydrolase domain-containing protein [Corynebacterium mendelii]